VKIIKTSTIFEEGLKRILNKFFRRIFFLEEEGIIQIKEFFLNK